MGRQIRKIFREKRASSFPMTIGIVLALILLLCGISEYFRLQVIAAGVREAVEDAMISTVNDNYAGVYHGAGRDIPEAMCHLEKETGRRN